MRVQALTLASMVRPSSSCARTYGSRLYGACVTGPVGCMGSMLNAHSAPNPETGGAMGKRKATPVSGSAAMCGWLGQGEDLRGGHVLQAETHRMIDQRVEVGH